MVYSVERLVAVSCPLTVRAKMTVRRAIYAETVVLLLSTVYSMEPMVTEYYVLANDDRG